MIGIHVHEQYVPVACALANKEINQIFEFVLLCYCYDFAPKNFMFQWIDEVSATPPYQLMADGDQATRIAAERVWPNIKLLMCYIHVR